MTRFSTGLLILILVAVAPPEVFALISGGEGNKPIPDPGWPRGASVIFNHAGRVAWWEGPPLGGGQWHAECRGDTRALNAVLVDFARLDVKRKRVVVQDCAGHSFWLAPNHVPEQMAAAKIDWIFSVWQSASWEHLHKLQTDLNPTEPGESSPSSQIDVFTAGIDWAGITVPEGIEVVDQRLVAHGFSDDDGVVIEGQVKDLSTGKPLTATIRLQRVEPQPTGGYLYPTLAEAKTDALGRWVLRKVPEGWLRVVVEADDFASRVAGHARFDGQPRWQSYDSGLARAASVSGRVTDEAGKPLPDVDVRLGNVQSEAGGHYDVPQGYTFKTNAEGRFRADQVPVGKATVWIHKPGYCRPGLGLPIITPGDNVELRMLKSSRVRVTVDFTARERPGGYIVMIAPEGGEVIGSYGGSGNLDARDQMTFENVPPGRYLLRGRPNPGADREQTEPVTVDLQGGQTTEVTLKAR